MAEIYFNAWRVWLKVDCGHPCLAGAGVAHAGMLWVGCAARCTGEVPLAMWLSQNCAHPQYELPRKYTSKPRIFRYDDLVKSLRALPEMERATRISALSAQVREDLCPSSWPANLNAVHQRPFICWPRWSTKDECNITAKLQAEGRLRCDFDLPPHLQDKKRCNFAALADAWAVKARLPSPLQTWRSMTKLMQDRCVRNFDSKKNNRCRLMNVDRMRHVRAAAGCSN